MAGITYRGDGAEFVYGVPARDLTAEEWAALGDAERDAAAVSGLYDIPTADPPADDAAGRRKRATRAEGDSTGG